MATPGASSDPASSQPRPYVDPRVPDYLLNEQARLDKARQVYGGHSGVSVDAVYQILYTQGTAVAIDRAVDMVEQAGQSGPTQSSQPGQSSASPEVVDWVREAHDDDQPPKTHYEVNLMQNRFGENFPTMFNPARHTVIIAGRPVQATWDGNLVMRLQPCGDNHSFKHLVQFLFSPGALVALRVYLCPST